jgi:hypothetical protein
MLSFPIVSGAHMIEITGKSRCDAHLEPYDKASQSHEIIITVQSTRDAHAYIYVSVFALS